MQKRKNDGEKNMGRKEYGRDDFIRKWMLFRCLVQSVVSYRVEVQGWEEKEVLEKVMIDYIRWNFRLEYILHTEVHNYERAKDGWGIRALRYEEELRKKERKAF